MRVVSKDYDAAIVGAGPAGSCAALRLAEAGLKVLVVEQQKTIGETVQCAEFVPYVLKRHVSLRDTDVAQKVQGIKTFIFGELAHVMRAPGYTLNRSSWESYLADRAARAGAKVMTGVRATDAGEGTVTLQNGAGHATVSADYILGCDGPHSLISRKLGNKPGKNCVAMQHELVLARPLEHACIYFDPAYYGGYAWVFPKGRTANIGMAVHASLAGKLKELLNRFCEEMASVQVVREGGACGRQTGGLIPSAGLVERLAGGHMLLAGDAAGCTNPITGAGIVAAVVSGQLAATAVLEERRGDLPALAEKYPRILTAEYGQQLARARSRFLVRERDWSSDRQEFIGLIRRSWIAFAEYYAQ